MLTRCIQKTLGSDLRHTFLRCHRNKNFDFTPPVKRSLEHRLDETGGRPLHQGSSAVSFVEMQPFIDTVRRWREGILANSTWDFMNRVFLVAVRFWGDWYTSSFSASVSWFPSIACILEQLHNCRLGVQMKAIWETLDWNSFEIKSVILCKKSQKFSYGWLTE